ncbi:MAG: hypothetical protein BECKG1743D_GA0114223_105121 [Candidatus Kentron sp. G]|nr:MAG: hypothetical protein BECKG1743D_GA0114223_105121 [Candidatus Kentron sp. G]VFN06955.1 MAG: hypothetical protein BECKG1743E_GA0114224_110981 [Candidatus Kentron sp. G]
MCSGKDPAHSGTFHAVFDHSAASPFDYPGCDRVAGSQILSIVHSFGIVYKIAENFFQLDFLLVR